MVTGGASAVYGSDAMAGVVNFIMKRDFEGIQIDGQFGEYMHSNDNGYVHERRPLPEPAFRWCPATPPTGAARISAF